MDNSAIGIKDQIDCIRRELKMRRKVYPGMVTKGTKTQEDADREIDAMEAVLKTLLACELEGVDSLFYQPGKGVLVEFGITLQPSVELPEGAEAPNLKAIYLDGFLESILNIGSASKVAQNPAFAIPVANTLERISAIRSNFSRHYLFTQLTTTPVNQKIAAFCVAYKEQFGETYKVNPKNAAKWKSQDYRDIPADPDLLAFYMQTSEFPCDGPKGIGDYLARYSALSQLQAKARARNLNPHGFPGHFDPKLYHELKKGSATKYQAYRKHLARLGYKPKNNAKVGETWVKEKQA